MNFIEEKTKKKCSAKKCPMCTSLKHKNYRDYFLICQFFKCRLP